MKRIKSIIYLVCLLVCLFSLLAAVHDVMRGEPDLRPEYLAIIFSLLGISAVSAHFAQSPTLLIPPSQPRLSS